MNVIKNDPQFTQQINNTKRVKTILMFNCYSSLVAMLLVLTTLSGLIITPKPAAAAGPEVPVKSIAQISVDDDGNELNYPNFVFFDPVEEEIYLINGGTNRVIVYGPDFFPRISIGSGRGVRSPVGGTVMPNGEVYITQGRSYRNARPSITILNGAFFVEREIFFDEIPEIANFKPRQLALSRDGLIYVTGENYRGILVLDNDGNFLRKLEPMDMITLRKDKEEIEPEGEEASEEEDLYSQIPEEFRPKTSTAETPVFEEVLGPVKIIGVTIDSKGNLYLVSLETSKIYVYGPDESFLFSFGTKGGSPRQLSQPRSLAIDEEQGLIFVVDYMRHTILAYDMTGQYLFEFGGRGYGPGYFNFPNDIAINNYGQLIVADLFNKRVQVLEVMYKEISIYLEKSESGSLPEASDGLESFEKEGQIPEQPEDLIDQEEGEDTSLEEMYQIIKKEKDEGDEAGEIVGEEKTEEAIIDEEIIEEVIPELPGPKSQFDEPLVTPE